MFPKVPPKLAIRIAAALTGIFLVLTYCESRLKSPAMDEPPHIASGLSYVTTGIFRGNPQHPPFLKELSGLSLLAGGIAWPQTQETDWFLHGDVPKGNQPEWAIGNRLIAENGPDHVLFWARLPFLFVSCLLPAVVFLWGRRMLGQTAALGAVLLCVLNPVIIGHAFLVTMDVGAAAFSMLFLFALWNYIQRPAKVRLLWCGLALAAALGAKFSNVLLIPVGAILIAAAYAWRPASKAATAVGRNEPCPCGSGKKYKACHGKDAGGAPVATPQATWLSTVGAFAAICAIAFIVIQAMYFFGEDPLAYYRGLLAVNRDHNPEFYGFLGGHFSHRFLSYFVAAFLLKTPISSLVLTTIGLAVLIRTTAIGRLDKLFLLLPPAAIMAAHTMLADNIGVRYIMSVLPFAHLLGGIGLAWMLESTARWMRPAAAVLCAWLVIAAAGIYPDHLSYFNEAACLPGHAGSIGLDGGSACGIYWLDDSNVDWGQGYKQLKAWLDRNAPGRRILLFSPYALPSEPYGIQSRSMTNDDMARGPQPGLYAVSASLMARMPVAAPQFAWLQKIPPRAVIGHAFYILDIPGGSARSR
jgi:hypothetical protein